MDLLRYLRNKINQKGYFMKKLYLIAFILVFSVAACKKEKNTQIQFSIKNMMTLVAKSSDYIKKVSPGSLDNYEANSYMDYYMENEIDSVNEVYIYYQLDEYDECSYIDVISNYINSLNDSRSFMKMAEKEIGTAEYYYVSYFDNLDTLHEVTYHTMADIWTYIDTAAINVNAINEVIGLYHYDKYYVLAGGYYFTNPTGLLSLIEIGFYENLPTSKSGTRAKNDLKPGRKFIQYKPDKFSIKVR